MIIEDIRKAIAEVEEDEALELVKQAVEEGTDAKEVLEEGVMAGLKAIGELYQSGEYFLSELMIGGKLVDECIRVLNPYLPKAEGPQKGTVVIGAVQGDLHDIGYGIVSKQLQLAGYEVHGIGIDVPAMTFIDKAKEYQADIIGLSAFLVTTIPNCNQVINSLKDLGIRGDYKVIIGGAETSQEVADKMGADGWAINAIDAVKLCDKLMGHV